MAATHQGLLMTSCCPGHVQMTCKGDFVALPLTNTTVGVWWLEDLSSKPMQLSGHQKNVTAVCFGHRTHPILLCSASEDFIYVWNISKVLAGRQLGADGLISGLAVGKDLGYVLHISFNAADCLISACIGKEVWILNIQSCKLHSLLEGHTSDVTQAHFCQHREFVVVTVSEDRTFKVWNIEQCCLLYQSTIMSAHSFLCLDVDPVQEQMAIGAADGKVRLFDLTDGSGFRCIHELDVGQILQRYLEKKEQCTDLLDHAGPALITSQPSWQFEEQHRAEERATFEAGVAVLGVFFCGIADQPTKDEDSEKTTAAFFSPHTESSLKEVFHVPALLVVGTTAAILLVNCNTWEPLYILDFQEPVLSSSELENVQYTIATAGSFAFMKYKTCMLCLVGSLFHNTVNIVNIRIPTPNEQKRDHCSETLAQRFSQSVAMATGGVCSRTNTEDSRGARGAEFVSRENLEPITVLSSAPLCSNSPLKAELVLKAATKQQQQQQQQQRKSSHKGGVQDQPLTFHSKIKSSGYTAQPRSKMFSPKMSASKKTSSSSRKVNSTLASRTAPTKQYPFDAPPPTNLREKMSLSDLPSPVNNIVFSGDGRQLACALANRTAHVLRTPPTGKHSVLTGHDGAVTSVHFNHDGTWLLTSSSDKTVRLWSPALSDPLLVFSSVNHNFSSELSGGTKVKGGSSVSCLVLLLKLVKLYVYDNPAFSKEITQARFYYVDKFVLLSCGNALYMYKYHVDQQKQEIKRYQTNNKYKLVEILQQERAQNITCFSSVNGFHSYIVLCCGSNKSIQVFDMNVGRSVRVVLDAHTRPVHAIRQNEGSASVSHPPDAYDLFLTAAVSDGIKLWDLRTNRCVRRYEGHVNRSHPVGVAFSPCSRYIAAGSEDRSAYLFDIRGNTFCHRLTGHTDVVTDVTFHPGHPQLVTASLDGKLRFYNKEGTAETSQ